MTIADVHDTRPPTAAELVASILYFDRYIVFDGDVIAFWPTLTPADQDHARYLVRAVIEATTLADQDDAPRCPKRCDVATRPEFVAPGRWLCTACGSEFPWPLEHPPDAAAGPGAMHAGA